MTSCPFYGLAMFGATPSTIPIFQPTHGNQCALITHARAPCYMEMDGLRPDWKECGRNPAINGTYEYGIAEARRRMELKRASEDRER
jgi:hypothetical protein